MYRQNKLEKEKLHCYQIMYSVLKQYLQLIRKTY